MEPADLDAVHEVLSAALTDIDASCRELSIDYCLVAGSALGAVRHQGFIPWDDDLDLAMRVKDFERFVALGCQSLGARYQIQTRRDDPILGATAKVYLEGTRAPSDFGAQNRMTRPIHGGLFVDIFVWYPMSRFRLVVHFERFLGWLSYVHPWAHSMRRSPAQPRLKRLRWHAIHGTPRWLVRQAQHYLWARAKQRNTGMWGLGLGGVNGPTPYAGDLLFPTRMAPFEGLSVPIPNDPELFLEETFGPDFMTPPSSNEQMSHSGGFEVDPSIWTERFLMGDR